MVLAAAVIIAELLICGTTTEVDPDDFLDAVLHMSNGDVPYTDFPYEFPPLALVFISIPALFSTDPVGYRIAFAVVAFLFIAGTYHLSLLTVEKWRGDGTMTVKIAVPEALFIMVFMHQLVCKNDVFVIFFVALGMYAYVRDRRIAAYIIITAAAFIKIYPAIFVLAFILMDIAGGNRGERLYRAGKGLLAATVTSIAICTPLLMMHVSLPELFGWMTMHNGRGFQVESTVAVLIESLGNLGLCTYTVVSSYSTFDVQSPITDALQPNWSVAVVQVMLAAASCVVYHARTDMPDLGSPATLSLYLGALILAFVISNKVFSTQYMMWLLPLFFLPLFMDRRKMTVLYAYLVLTMVLSLFHNWESWLCIAMLSVRNMMLILLEVYLIMILLGRTERADRAIDRIYDGAQRICSKIHPGT